LGSLDRIDAATEALRVLQAAHQQWTEALVAARGVDVDVVREHGPRNYGYIVTVLAVARGLDDMCKDVQPYATARPEREVLLDASRYACNRLLHQFVAMSQPMGGITFPIRLPIRFDKFAGYRWAPPAFLPPVETEDRRQQAMREKYISLLAGHRVGPTLAALRSWFEEQIPLLKA